MTEPQKIEHYEYEQRLNKGDKVRLVWTEGDQRWTLETEWGGWDNAYMDFMSKGKKRLPLTGGERDPEVYLLERYEKPWPEPGAIVMVKAATAVRGGLGMPQLPLLTQIDEDLDANFFAGSDTFWFNRRDVTDWAEVTINERGGVELVD